MIGNKMSESHRGDFIQIWGCIIMLRGIVGSPEANYGPVKEVHRE